MGRVGKFQGFCFSFFLAKGLKEHVIAYNTYIHIYIHIYRQGLALLSYPKSRDAIASKNDSYYYLLNHYSLEFLIITDLFKSKQES